MNLSAKCIENASSRHQGVEAKAGAVMPPRPEDGGNYEQGGGSER